MGSCQSKPETNGRGHQLVSKEDQADLKQVLTAAGLADLLPKFIDEEVDVKTMLALPSEELAKLLGEDLALKAGQRMRLQAELGKRKPLDSALPMTRQWPPLLVPSQQQQSIVPTSSNHASRAPTYSDVPSAVMAAYQQQQEAAAGASSSAPGTQPHSQHQSGQPSPALARTTMPNATATRPPSLVMAAKMMSFSGIDAGSTATVGLSAASLSANATAFRIDNAAALLSGHANTGSHPASAAAVYASTLTLLDSAKKAKAVKENAVKVAERAFGMVDTLRLVEDEVAPELVDKHMGTHLQRFAALLDECTKTVKEFSSSRFVVRLLTAPTDDERFDRHSRDLGKLGQELGFVLHTSAALKALKNNTTVQARLLELGNRLEETRDFNNSGAVLCEKIELMGGLDLILKDQAKLVQFAAQLEVDANELKNDLLGSVKELRIQLEALENAKTIGTHLLIKHPRVRALWRRYFKSERVHLKEFFSHLGLFIEEAEGTSSGEITNTTSKALLTGLLVEGEGGDTVHNLVVNRVFSGPSTTKVTHLVKTLVDAQKSAGRVVNASALPQLSDRFVGRKDIVQILLGTLTSSNGGIMWLTGPSGVGKSAAALEAVRHILDATDCNFASVHFVCVQGVSASNLALSIVASVHPQGINTDASALLLWATTLQERTLLVVDKLSPSSSSEATNLLNRLRQFPKLSVLVTSRATAPSGAKEILLEPLSNDESTQLVKKLIPLPTQEQIDAARKSRLPGEITISAISAHLDKLKTWTAATSNASTSSSTSSASASSSAALRSFRQQVDAIKLLSVFSLPFTEEAALALIAKQTDSAQVPRESTRAVLRSLVDDGILIHAGHKGNYWLQIRSSESASSIALECFCMYYCHVLDEASTLYSGGNTSSALHLIDTNRGHLDRLLLEIRLPVQCLSKLLDALLTSGDLLNMRWSNKQLQAFNKRVFTTVESVEGKALPAHDLVLAWILANDNVKEALMIVLNSTSVNTRTLKLVEAYVLHRDGVAKKSLGQHGDALISLQKALPIRRDLLGENHLDTASTYNHLGMVYHEQGDEVRALEYYEKALAVKMNVLGEFHPSTAFSYYNIGSVYKDQGNYAKAIEFYKKSLSVQRAVLGLNHLSTATSYNNIGGVYNEQGNFERALENYEKALAVYKSLLGEKHLMTATSYNNIGDVYSNQGDKAKALEYYEIALVVTRDAVGNNHSSTATAYNNIATVHYSQGDKVHALEYYEKALAVFRAVLGDKHPSTAASYNSIGHVYANQGNYVRALEYYEKALAVRKVLLGDSHPPTATSFNNIGAVYKYQGDYARALEYYEKALAVQSWNLKQGKVINEAVTDEGFVF